MRSRRPVIIAGMAGGVVWALVLLAWVPAWLPPAGIALLPALALALFLPALVIIAMIGRLAQRRFFDDALIDGQPFKAGSGGAIDQRVLTNSLEQLALALAVWPMLALSLGARGPATAIALGLGLTLARVLFWVGYHLSPPLRGLGFAMSFYPTVLAALWVVWRWLWAVA